MLRQRLSKLRRLPHSIGVVKSATNYDQRGRLINKLMVGISDPITLKLMDAVNYTISIN